MYKIEKLKGRAWEIFSCCADEHDTFLLQLFPFSENSSLNFGFRLYSVRNVWEVLSIK